MNKKNIELRNTIQKLLMDGYAQCKVARMLNIPKSTVQYHTKILLKEKAIRSTGNTTPIVYVKGINSYLYDQICTTTDGGDVEESYTTNDELCCIHNLQFRFNIINMPGEDRIRWEKIKVVNNATMRWKNLSIYVDFLKKELKVSLQECNKKTIVIRFERVLVSSENIEKKNNWINTIAHYMRKVLSKFGYRLSLPEQCGKRHYAIREPTLDKLQINKKIDDKSWYDKTGIEKGKAHWETNDSSYVTQRNKFIPVVIKNTENINEIDNKVVTIDDRVSQLENEVGSIKDTQSEIFDELKKIPEEVRNAVREGQLYKPSKFKDNLGYR